MATECSRDGHSGKRKRHSHQQRQAGSAEGLVRAREYEWQNRQDARTQNRQNTANKRQEINQHRTVPSSFLIVCNVIDLYPEVGFLRNPKVTKPALAKTHSNQASKPADGIDREFILAIEFDVSSLRAT